MATRGARAAVSDAGDRVHEYAVASVGRLISFSETESHFRFRDCQKYSAESIVSLRLFAIVRAMSKIAETAQERLERLRTFAAQLAAKTDCPLMREKIAAIVAGIRVDH
jgi:hypothetical protein